uniref:MFS domain-containing protein n=1 Tax=Macrostomum lignano TaxID=282301 RepID=A0A1I8H6P9_9PLAT
AGIFVSCCFAPLADAFGRKLPFILFAYIDLTSTILVIFVHGPARFFMGFGSPAVLTGVAYLTELISEDYHGLHGNFYWILWVVGYTTSGVIAYLVMEWRLQMVLVAAIIGYLSYPWSLIDSPKWLFASGHQSAAKDSLLRLFRRHGLDTATVETMKVDEESTELKGESETLQSSQANAELDSDSKKR